MKQIRTLNALALAAILALAAACQQDDYNGRNDGANNPDAILLVLNPGEKPAYTVATTIRTTTTDDGTGTTAWAVGDVITVLLTYYSDDAGTQRVDASLADATPDATQTLTCTGTSATSGNSNGNSNGNGSNDTPAAPQWSLSPAVLSLPAGTRSLRALYRAESPEDPYTHTRELMAGRNPSTATATGSQTQDEARAEDNANPAGTLVSVRLTNDDDADDDATAGRHTFTLPAPVWTRRTALLRLFRLQPGQTVLVTTAQLPADAAQGTKPTVFGDVLSAKSSAPTSGGTGSEADGSEAVLFHLPLPQGYAQGSGTTPDLTFSVQNPAVLPADRPAQFTGIAYLPQQRFTLDARQLMPGGTTGGAGGDTQGTVEGNGTSTLTTDVFNGNNPRWVISGGGGTGDATVLTNVRAALNEIFQPSSNFYDGANGYIDLTLTGVTTLPMQDNHTGAFDLYKQLRSITALAVTSIGQRAFNNCKALTTASLPKATSIGSEAFLGCMYLTTASLPEAKGIGDNAFKTCTSLKTISLPKATGIGNYAFLSCNALKTISLPEATSIGTRTFNGCTALNTLNLPKATSIGQYAFEGCTALTTLSLPEATTIWHHAFNGCTALTTLSLTAEGDITLNPYVGNTFDGFNNSANCTLILNSDKNPANTGSTSTPKPEGNKWGGVTWKDITYQ